ncbi:hypothetical protein [Herpetosiphon gulosus]|uniref:hypothetical protein n=1 Tax=Herpetosiphon gulosus TaxID=1973496 RepID=UPI0031EA8D46
MIDFPKNQSWPFIYSIIEQDTGINGRQRSFLGVDDFISELIIAKHVARAEENHTIPVKKIDRMTEPAIPESC